MPGNTAQQQQQQQPSTADFASLALCSTLQAVERHVGNILSNASCMDAVTAWHQIPDHASGACAAVVALLLTETRFTGHAHTGQTLDPQGSPPPAASTIGGSPQWSDSFRVQPCDQQHNRHADVTTTGMQPPQRLR
jgi:hypothetical protein